MACHPAPVCPQLDHVILAVMENKALQQLVDKDKMPNIYNLVQKYSPAMQYYGYTHNSEPNCKS